MDTKPTDRQNTQKKKKPTHPFCIDCAWIMTLLRVQTGAHSLSLQSRLGVRHVNLDNQKNERDSQRKGRIYIGTNINL